MVAQYTKINRAKINLTHNTVYGFAIVEESQKCRRDKRPAELTQHNIMCRSMG